MKPENDKQVSSNTGSLNQDDLVRAAEQRVYRDAQAAFAAVMAQLNQPRLAADSEQQATETKTESSNN